MWGLRLRNLLSFWAAALLIHSGSSQMAPPQTLGTEDQIACLVDFLKSSNWFTLHVFLPELVTSSSAVNFLKRLAAVGIFAHLHRGNPIDTSQIPSGQELLPHVWFTPDHFQNSSEERTIFESVRLETRHKWLLVSLSGVTEGQLLGGYASQHRYMVVENGTARVYSGRDYNRSSQLRGSCRDGRYRRFPRSLPGTTTYHKPMQGITLRTIYARWDNGSLNALPTRLTIENERLTGGLIGSILLLLQRILGFEYTLRGVRQTNRSAWDNSVEELHANRADLFAGWIVESPRRRQLISFTVPFSRRTVGAIVPVGSFGPNDMFDFKQRFTAGTWLAILGLQLLAVLVLYIVAHAETRLHMVNPGARAESLSFWILIVFGILSNQGAAVHRDTAASYRLAVFSVYMLALLLNTAYSGNLLSSVAVRETQLPFTSLHQALQNGWRVQITKSEALQDMVIPVLFQKNMSDLPLAPTGPPRNGEIQMLNIELVKQMNTKRTTPDQPRVCMWPLNVLQFPMSLATRPSFPYKPLIDRALRQLHEAGIIQQERRRWKADEPQELFCQTDVVLESDQLGLLNLRQIFLIPAVGVGAAMAVLVIELIFMN